MTTVEKVAWVSKWLSLPAWTAEYLVLLPYVAATVAVALAVWLRRSEKLTETESQLDSLREQHTNLTRDYEGLRSSNPELVPESDLVRRLRDRLKEIEDIVPILPDEQSIATAFNALCATQRLVVTLLKAPECPWRPMQWRVEVVSAGDVSPMRGEDVDPLYLWQTFVIFLELKYPGRVDSLSSLYDKPLPVSDPNLAPTFEISPRNFGVAKRISVQCIKIAIEELKSLQRRDASS